MMKINTQKLATEITEGAEEKLEQFLAHCFFSVTSVLSVAKGFSK